MGSMLPDILLTALLLVLLLWAAWMIQQLFLGAPFIVMPDAVLAAACEMVKPKPGERIADLGAGDGRVLLALKRCEPSVIASGWEIGIVPWLLSRLRCRGSGIRLYFGTLFRADLKDMDVVVVYLWPSLMPPLLAKLERELKPGCRVLSLSFPLPGRAAEHERIVRMPHENLTLRLYRW
jgi:hypothetical protein